MRKVLLGAAIAALAIPSLAAEREAPGPDIHFKGPQGELQRGVRCATRGSSLEQRAAVDRFLSTSGAAAVSGGQIDVVFHIITDGSKGNVSNLVAAQMQVLNQAYSGTGFSFNLRRSHVVVDRRAFTGCYSNQNFKKTLAEDPANTLNIYTCQPKGGILGYAYLPQSFSETDWHHGVVLLWSSLPGGGADPYDEGDTATHEVGHYLGLEHTFQGGCNAPGDSVDDTAFEQSAAFGCPTGRDTCPQSGQDPIKNFMDYTDDACMNTFSGGQTSRMQTMVSAYKPSLLY